jgi:hypothetical protein
VTRRTRAVSAVLVGGITLGLSATSVGAAGSPTCSDVLDIAVHGEHVVADYVMGTGHDVVDWPPAGAVGAAVAGTGAAVRGGPKHEGLGVGPGASFCIEQANTGG